MSEAAMEVMVESKMARRRFLNAGVTLPVMVGGWRSLLSVAGR